jgi:hypothetical protein
MYTPAAVSTASRPAPTPALKRSCGQGTNTTTCKHTHNERWCWVSAAAPHPYPYGTHAMACTQPLQGAGGAHATSATITHSPSTRHASPHACTPLAAKTQGRLLLVCSMCCICSNDVQRLQLLHLHRCCCCSGAGSGSSCCCCCQMDVHKGHMLTLAGGCGSLPVCTPGRNCSTRVRHPDAHTTRAPATEAYPLMHAYHCICCSAGCCAPARILPLHIVTLLAPLG